VFAVLALAVLWQLLTRVNPMDKENHELCDIAALAHTFYATGHLVVALGLAQFLLGDTTPTANCEETLSGVAAPLEGSLGLFAVWELHTLIQVFRNLVLSFLATAQPTSELHRGLNVALTIACVVLSSEPDASSWADVRFITATPPPPNDYAPPPPPPPPPPTPPPPPPPHPHNHPTKEHTGQTFFFWVLLCFLKKYI